MDIIAGKLRGYLGLLDDLRNRPEKVLAACEALAPHLCSVALATSDPAGTVPIGFWMHRSCVPFVNPKSFNDIYWPTLKPIIQELWRNGRQTLFYAEGDWNYHLDAFAELPDRSVVYHVDRADILEVHRKLGDKFCLSGGIPNALLAYGTEEQVRDACKEVIDGVARDGGYIMDASAIVQNDAKVENMRALTDFTREYGVYSTGHAPKPRRAGEPSSADPQPFGRETKRAPGVCAPWAEEKQRLPAISGDEAIVKRVWEDIDALGYTYIWQVLLSF